MTNEELLEVFKEVKVGDRVMVNDEHPNEEVRDELHWKVVHKTKDLLTLIYGKHKYHTIICMLPAMETYNNQEKGKFSKSHFYNGYEYSQDIDKANRNIIKKTDELQKCLDENVNKDIIYDSNLTNFNQLSHRYSVSLFNLKIIKKGK